VRSENLFGRFGKSMQRRFVTAGLMESGGGYCSSVTVRLSLDPLFLVVYLSHFRGVAIIFYIFLFSKKINI
jgi:hypothetical protein